MSESCTWREDEDGNWCTECGNIFVLDGAPPDEHGMRFCCYCGRALVGVQFVEDGGTE